MFYPNQSIECDSQTMRIFVSVNLPDRIRHELQVIQSKLRKSMQNWRWIDPANMHITLKFIGEYPEDQLDVLEKVLTPSADSMPPFDIDMDELGTFPPRGKPTVLWIGIQQGAAQLKKLSELVTTSLRDANIDADHKPFVPHITVARAKRDGIAQVPDSTHLPVFNTRMTVESFYVMESELKPSGAQYKKHVEFMLKG